MLGVPIPVWLMLAGVFLLAFGQAIAFALGKGEEVWGPGFWSFWLGFALIVIGFILWLVH